MQPTHVPLKYSIQGDYYWDRQLNSDAKMWWTFQTELECPSSALECRTAWALQSAQCSSSAALLEHCSHFIIWAGGTAFGCSAWVHCTGTEARRSALAVQELLIVGNAQIAQHCVCTTVRSGMADVCDMISKCPAGSLGTAGQRSNSGQWAGN